MAKARANLTIEPAVWDAALAFFKKHPEMGSISSLFENTLKEFLKLMPPFVERAKAGDKEAALILLQMGFNTQVAQSSLMLNKLYEAIDPQTTLFDKTSLPKSIEEKGTKPRKKSK